MRADLVSHELNPLFMLLKTKDWKTALRKIEDDPRLADGTVDLQGFYEDSNLTTRVNALHIACNNLSPVIIIEALLGANELLASEKESSYKRLPLHIATMKQCPSRLIATLLSKHPEAARVKDIHGRLPIHYASKDKRHGRLVLRFLLKVHPESVRVADNKGFLPLHVACRSGMPMCIIETLLSVAPDTILLKTNNGATPVHCAKRAESEGNAQEGLVEDVTRIADEVKEVVDRAGHMYVPAARPSAASVASGSTDSSNLRLDFAGLLTINFQEPVPDVIDFTTRSSTLSITEESSTSSAR